MLVAGRDLKHSIRIWSLAQSTKAQCTENTSNEGALKDGGLLEAVASMDDEPGRKGMLLRGVT